MVEEVGTIHDTIEQLNAKLAEAQEAKGELLSIEKNLQNDIGVKNNSLRIDKHKCLGIRYFNTILTDKYLPFKYDICI